MKRFLTNVLFAATLVSAAPLAAANVVTDWNTIAATTIVTNGGKASVASGVWFAYTSIAVYDAVNAVHRNYQPFYYNGIAPAGASDEAAAVAAAHRVLVTYFRAQQAGLDVAFTKSLSGIAAPAQAITDGAAVGEAAATALISARVNDGLEANVPYTPGTGPGVWQPTPPGLLPALTPWLGQMRPFALKRPDHSFSRRGLRHSTASDGSRITIRPASLGIPIVRSAPQPKEKSPCSMPCTPGSSTAEPSGIWPTTTTWT